MQAIILAGGFGTRLQSVVKDVPKPMADIAGAPFLAYLLSHLKNFGITDAVISVGYLQQKIIEYFGNSYLGINLSYATEDKPLGTGGAIVNSLKFIDQTKPVVVVNGDTFLQIDYQKLLQFYQEKKSQLTLVLRQLEDCSRYGRVVLDENSTIKSFEEKSSEKKSGLINGGIYLLDPRIFNKFLLAESFSFEADFLMKYLDEIQPQGFTVDEYFIDIGIPDDYARAQVELPSLSPLRHPELVSGSSQQILKQVQDDGEGGGDGVKNKNKALFLDRDGIINIDHGYVFEIEKFDFVEGIFELCQRAQELGYLIIIVTNQGGIGLGYYSEEDFIKLTRWMENEFAKRQIKITKTFYCPYRIDATVEKYCQDSFDRKPKPGMLLKAIAEFNIDPKKSLMLGDNETDMQAADAAGVGSKLLVPNPENLKEFFLQE